MFLKRKGLESKSNAKAITLILDGKHLAYRSLHTFGQQKLSYNDEDTGIHYGFFKIVQKLVKKFKPINVIITWDSDSTKSVRKQEFEGYKNRHKSDDYELLLQLERLKKEYLKLIPLCDELGFASYYLEGYEADDLIALWIDRFDHCTNIIVTNDEDMYQCLYNNNWIYDTKKDKIKDSDWFRSKYGFESILWSMVKAIGGCKSDTVPGIKGVSDKTAIQYYKDKEEMKPYLLKRIEDNFEQIPFWLSLVKLPHPNLKGERLRFKQTEIDMDKLENYYERMGFFSLLNEIDELKNIGG